MNIFDKVLSRVSPERALKREMARQKLDAIQASGYSRHGASYGRKSLQRWRSKAGDADADIVDNIETLRARSRDLYMGAPIATGAIKTIRTNVVGSGLMLDAQIDAEFLGLTPEKAAKWERDTEREFALWANSVECDAERRQTFVQLQALALLSAILSGDVFVTLPIIKRNGSPYDVRIGLIEADRVCNPLIIDPTRDVFGGVELDAFGATVAYYVADRHPHALNWRAEAKWKRVVAFGHATGRRNVLHLMCDVERPSQRRGVPLLAPVIESLKQIDRYTDAELMAAVVSGMFTVFIKSKDPDSPLSQAMMPADEIGNDPADYALGNGSIVALDEGEEIQIANPNRPNPAFDGFVLALCRQVGAALEIPYELLLKNFNASYSASRAALLEAWKMFRMRREWLVTNFCQPIYEEWLTEAILKGRVKAPGFFEDPAIRAAWCKADWYGDAQGQLDPLKEAKAAKVRVDEGFSTREREASELTGMKFEAIHAVRKREEEMRRDAGLTAQIVADDGGANGADE